MDAATIANTAGAVVVIDPATLRRLIEAAVRAALARSEGSPQAVPEWLDAQATADLLGVHRRTVTKMAARGDLPSARVGRLLRFRREDVLALLEVNPTSAHTSEGEEG